MSIKGHLELKETRRRPNPGDLSHEKDGHRGKHMAIIAWGKGHIFPWKFMEEKTIKTLGTKGEPEKDEWRGDIEHYFQGKLMSECWETTLLRLGTNGEPEKESKEGMQGTNSKVKWHYNIENMTCIKFNLSEIT